MRHLRRSSVVCLMTCLALSVTAARADWPSWRGPNRDGKSIDKGLLDRWSDKGPPLVWQAEGLGGGYSSVAIANGNAYTLGRRQNAEHVTAIDLKSGKVLWSTSFGGGDHSNGTPTVDGQLLYAIGLKGDLICASAETGQEVWKKEFSRDFRGRMMSGWGYSESPLIDGEWLLCTPGANDAMIVALDKKTGADVWRSAVSNYSSRGNDGAGYSSIVVSNGAGVKQYVQLTGHGVIGVRASDGKFLWGYDKVANGTANIPTPIVSGDHVFCSTGYGTGAALLKLVRDGAAGVKAEEVYFLSGNEFQNHHGGMVLIGKHIFAGAQHNNGFPTCLDLMTGKVVWGGKQRGPGSGSAAITFADGNLVFRYQDGTVALIEATPAAYRLKGSFKPVFQQGESWAHPVVDGGRLYLREQDRLMCYDLRSDRRRASSR